MHSGFMRKYLTKVGVTRSAMPTALEVGAHLWSASAIGTTDFVIGEFIPLLISFLVERQVTKFI